MLPKLRTQILLVDAIQSNSDALKSLINQQPDLIVCGQIYRVSDVLPSIQNTSPQLIMLSEYLENSDNTKLGQFILDHYPNLSIIIMAIENNLEHQHKARQAGFHGYLFRFSENAHETILNGIRTVLAGTTYFPISPYNPNPLFGDPAVNESARWQSLNDQEIEVIKFIMDGLDNYHIAVNLYVSHQIIRVYRYKIYDKLGIYDDTNLIHTAFRQGL